MGELEAWESLYKHDHGFYLFLYMAILAGKYLENGKGIFAQVLGNSILH